MTATADADKAIIFGDVHANITALKAVGDDMEARALGSNRYCLGDLVGYGTSPNEVVSYVRTRNIPTIMGNYDKGVGNNSDDCGCAYQTERAEQRGKRSIAWTNNAITEDNRAYLRNLPRQVTIEVGSFRTTLVHGSPRRINEYLYEDRPDASFERLLDDTETDVLVCGHTHIPYHRELPSGRHVVNAGSVGKPKDGDPRAGYVVLSAVEGELAVEFYRVKYDVDQVATEIEDSELPSEYARMLRDGTD